VFLAATGSWVLGQEQQQQQWPSWLPEDAKDAMNEMNDAQKDGFMGDEVCRLRLAALKKLSMVAKPEAGQLRSHVLMMLGFCDMRGEDSKPVMVLRRFEAAVSELNAPNEDMLLQNMDMAPMVLMKYALKALRDHKLSEAGVALRRCRAIYGRQWDKMMKMVMKQNKIEEAALPQMMPQLKTQPWAISILGFMDAVDAKLVRLDKYILAGKAQKDKKDRLDGKAGGSLAYLPVLPMEATTEVSRLPWVEQITDKFVILAGEADKANLEKHASLMKRTKPGSNCDKLPQLCEALKDVSDLSTNGFGESRLLVLTNKKQKLDICETNANVGVLIALKGSVKLVQGSAKTNVEERGALAYDLCLDASVSAEGADGALLLLLQAWHPEVAALERTTFIREKSKSWNLDEAQVKAVTKVANDAAKKSWEKTVKTWREGSTVGPELAATIAEAETKAADAKEAEAEEKRNAEAAADDTLKNAKEEMERKRQEKADAIAKMKAEKQARVEEVRRQELAKEPWRLDYRIIDAKEKLEALKEERRDANLKMEFDLSTSLTKDVSKAERKYQSVMEKAKKYYAKHGKVKVKGEKDSKEDAAGAAGAAGKDSGSSSSKAQALKKEIEGLEKLKKEASAAENYKEAATLKGKIKELNAKLEKMEL